MNIKRLRILGALGLAIPLSALAGQPVDVELRDRTTGEMLPVYWHDGDRHVAGEPGHEYEIRIRNHGYSRVLAVTSVDGVNVITGRTACPTRAATSWSPTVESRSTAGARAWRKSRRSISPPFPIRTLRAPAGRTTSASLASPCSGSARRCPGAEPESGRTADAAPEASREPSGDTRIVPATIRASAPAMASASIPGRSTRISSERARNPRK